MANIGTLSVKLIADLKKFTAGMKIAAKGVKTFASRVASSMRSAAKAIARFALSAGRSLASFATKWLKRATIAIGVFLVAALKLSANAEESENLVRESFEGMTDAIVKWSDQLQKSVGLNAVELRKQAGFLFLMTQSMGLTNEAAFDLASTLTELSADMASFRNESFEAMFAKIQSGIVGMTRPLKQIGINIQEDAVALLLMRKNIDATFGSLTQTEKIMARYILLLEQTSKDQGDLARTYDSLTNVVRVFMTQIKLLSREIGDVLRPEVTEIAIRMRDWLIGNRQDIVAWFAEAKATFMAFVNFLRMDFHQGFAGSLEGLLVIMRAIGEGSVQILKTAFVTVGENIAPWIFTGLKRSVLAIKKELKFIGEGLAELLVSAITGEDPIEPLVESSHRLGANLKEIYSNVKLELAGIVENTKKLNSEIGVTDEQLAEIAANKAKRQAEFDKEQIARLAATNAKIEEWTALLKKNAEASLEVSAAWSHTANTIKLVMTDANDAIKNSFADMLTGMAIEMDNFEQFAKDFIVNVMQAIARMQAELLAARILGETEGGLGLGTIISKGLGLLAGPAGQQQAAGAANAANFVGPPAPAGMVRGGIVKPVYAANGFAPKGSDTVPAMLTPGEGVLSKDLTAALREQLAVPGGGLGGNTVNITVQAIDAQNTATWLNNNKRQIAGVLGDTIRNNNPIRRLQGQGR